MTRNRIIIAIAVLLLAACGYWLYDNLIWTEMRVPAMPKGEAASNPLYAAQKLLTAMGANAQSSKVFQTAPEGDPKRGALIFPTERRTLTPRQRQSLLDWTAAGGHLILVTYTLEDEGDPPDPLLSAVGVRQKMNPAPKAEQNGDAARRRVAPRAAPGFNRFVKLPDRPCPEQTEGGTSPPRAAAPKVCFAPQFRLVGKDEPLWSAGDKDGIHALTVAHGQGRVTVLTDYDFMRTDQIGQADHADFLLALLGPDVTGLNVWLIPREDADGLRTLIWRYGWTVVLTLLLLAAATLWRDGARFGPLEPAPEPVRRSLIEHVRAGGEYLWRNRQALLLWQSTAAAARQRIARTLPGKGNAEQLAQKLAARTGADPERVRQALSPAFQPSADEFLRNIATLEHLRKKL